MQSIQLPEPCPQVAPSWNQLEAPAPRRGNAYSKPKPFQRDRALFEARKAAIKAGRIERKNREKEARFKLKHRKEKKRAFTATHKNGQPRLEDRLPVILAELQAAENRKKQR